MPDLDLGVVYREVTVRFRPFKDQSNILALLFEPYDKEQLMTFYYAIRSDCDGEAGLVLTDEQGIPATTYPDSGKCICFRPSCDGLVVSVKHALECCRFCYFIIHNMDMEAALSPARSW